MSIMVTGGTGYLGSYLAKYLVEEKGMKDVVLFDLYPDYLRVAEVKDNVVIVQGDMLEPYDLLGAMRKYDVDRVVHLAYILGDATLGKTIPYLRTQCMGTANVFEAALMHGVKRVVYSSSIAVYGKHKHNEALDEDAPAQPVEFYGACKLWNEHIAEGYHTQFGLDVVGLRAGTVFGLGFRRRGSYASGLTSGEVRRRTEASGLTEMRRNYTTLIELAALGEPVEMPPDDQMADWLYAADAAQAWYLALMAEDPPRRIYNLSAYCRRMGDVTAHLRRILPDVKITVGTVAARVGPIINTDRLKNELGFQPKYTLEEALTEYVSLVRRQAG